MGDPPPSQKSISNNGSKPESKAEPSMAGFSKMLDEMPKRDRALSDALSSIISTKECLRRVCDRMGEDKVEAWTSREDKVEVLKRESREVYELVLAVESRIAECEEKRRRDRREMENIVASLTEENRDIGSLLRAAVAEKEAVERRFINLKGSQQQKKGILQIAERGLQRVGFVFMMGAVAGDQEPEPEPEQLGSSNASVKSDGSECEDEVTGLASTVENIMKNLRLQVTDLRWSLEESRSNCESLQNLVDKQAHKIKKSELYIKDLEERESMLACNVEVLMLELTEAEEEVARWRAACELEVEAGKSATSEREKEVAFLKEELERIKSALDESNSKLKLKEKLATTAIAAQEAAEASLRLADIRSTGFRERIEELMRQVEEEAEHGRRERSGVRKRVRHMCWPWQALKTTSSSGFSSWGGNRRRRPLPELEGLLHLRI